MARKPYTGGPLNALNGKMGISAPHKSVSVNGLIKAHNPKSAAELEMLIAEHVGGGCTCGIISQGTVDDFGHNLYEAQNKVWGEYRYPLVQCIQWEYDLFILQMLKGTRMEDICKTQLADLLTDEYSIKDASHYVDEEIRVDLEVYKDKEKIAGIQVKPESFDRIRTSIQVFNKKANKKYGYPVLYAIYNYDKEDFINIDKVTEELKEL